MYNLSFKLRPLSFHTSTGPNLSLNGCSSIAWRHEDEYSAGYVFTSSSVTLGERVVVQILATENMYIGSLAFGLTSCDPSSLDCDSLPEDSDMLLDRPEYWVVSKDVANTPDVGDELSFLVNHDGSVEFSKNGAVPSVLMHVDISVPLWGFWDVYGNTQRLRMVGGTMDPVVRPDQVREDSSASRENDRNNRSMTDLVEEIRPNSPLQPVVPPRFSNYINSVHIHMTNGSVTCLQQCKICSKVPIKPCRGFSTTQATTFTTAATKPGRNIKVSFRI